VRFRGTSSLGDGQLLMEVFLKDSGSGGTAASLVLSNSATGSSTVQLAAVDIPDAIAIPTSATTTASLVVRAEVIGNTINGYVNGTQYIATSSSLYASQSGVGLAAVRTETSAADGDNPVICDAFTCGTVVPSTAGVRTRETYLVAVAGGDIYQSDSPPTAMVASTGGTDALNSSTFLMGATGASPSALDGSPANVQRHVYFCDGTNYKRLNLETNTVSTWTAVNGTLPVDSAGNVCRIMALYRGRIVMAGLITEPGNWFMTKQHDPLDIDYSPATQLVTSAVAGNNTDAGLVADRITALIPYGDNTLIFGGDKSIWRLTGDPADGGIIDNISYDTGVAGPDAWTRDPNGVLYFMGSNGMYRMAPGGGVPELISSGKLDTSFTDIDLVTTRPILSWDRDRQGCHVFLTGYNEPLTAPTQYWYDARTDGFWPEQLPISNGPTAALVFDGDAPGDRALLMGGRDGYIRTESDTTKSDSDGATTTAIDSFVDIGPLVGKFGRRIHLQGIQATLGAGADGATLQVMSGDTPEQAADSVTVRAARALSGGLNKWVYNPVAAGSLKVRLRNNTIAEAWSMEQVVIQVADGGLQREGAR